MANHHWKLCCDLAPDHRFFIRIGNNVAEGEDEPAREIPPLRSVIFIGSLLVAITTSRTFAPNIALPLWLTVISSPVLALSNASSPRHQHVMMSMTSRLRSRHHMKNLQSLTWCGFHGGIFLRRQNLRIDKKVDDE